MFNRIKTELIHLKFKLLGKTPTRYRINKDIDNGYTVSKTTGGISGENFIRITKGKKNFYYPNYLRKGTIRKNNYVLDIHNRKVSI
tara:strand:- start:1578 stop:1835 length:258 start_codon:yes stop_codon:yes gene_type:complete